MTQLLPTHIPSPLVPEPSPDSAFVRKVLIVALIVGLLLVLWRVSLV